MNYGIIVKVLGNLLLFVSVGLLCPLGISVYLGESDTQAFLITLVLLLGVSIPMALWPLRSRRVQVREALSIVVLGWVIVSFLGALPFFLSASIPSFVDALFESISGLTTTGATIIDDIEVLPRGILFWRSFMHWLGGMGIIVLTLAVLPALGVGGYRIYKAEISGPSAGKIAPKMRDTAKILYGVYLTITVLQVGLLYVGGLSLYDALVHTFGTVGTGGFSTHNASIGAFGSSYVTFVIAFFMLVAGVNFSLLHALYQGKWERLTHNSELRLYLAIIGVSVLLVAVTLHGTVYASWLEALEHSLFQVVSFTTTTGYVTADYESWPKFTQGLMYFLMFMGGCAGSTAGSMKIIRHLVLLKLVKREISQVLHPRAFIPIKVDGKSLPRTSEANIIAFFSLFVMVFVLGTLAIMFLEESLDFLTATSAVAATIGNVGPGFGLVGPTDTYSFFGPTSKLLLSFFMLLGRLELFTVFILLTPDFWRD